MDKEQKSIMRTFDTLMSKVSKLNDTVTVIYFINQLLSSIPDDSWKELDDMIEGQEEYYNPLKMGTVNRQRRLAEGNRLVVEALKNLKKAFEESLRIEQGR